MSGVNKVYIIGMGPGTADYLLPAAKTEIERADCLIGAERLLSQFSYQAQKKMRLEGRFKEAVSYIKKNKDKEKIAILVSGDPGLYSFLGAIRAALKKEEYAVIPGISTLQLAFAKIGESWQDARIISVHGRKKGNLAREIKGCGKVFLFTDTKFPPEKIAGYLLHNGIKNRRAIVFEALTYPNERIADTDLKALSAHSTRFTRLGSSRARSRDEVEPSNKKRFGLCAMIIMEYGIRNAE